ncbi:hypothetical protein WN07_15440 [Klebsiella pneumoniae]|nr:hypothetical protein AB190_00475 [Enterobacter asburiae]KJX15534.1 hypothetical protein SG82_19675 [Enterobacter hormaechei subsp. xiangfangensis]KSZ26531.1 hypothetical protein APU22_20705 [Klebsiella pneumoniae]KTJ75138.1 hypothetical protein ASU77_22365 [Enterobacter hormaechei subsp. steigerwaltii]KUQ20489.1 hypothetical protein AWI07_21980 [Enterobacter roggenkampii]KUQ93200.1 hypothetical protein AWI30_15480 [Enterobacter hormaechei subsp. oharae]
MQSFLLAFWVADWHRERNYAGIIARPHQLQKVSLLAGLRKPPVQRLEGGNDSTLFRPRFFIIGELFFMQVISGNWRRRYQLRMPCIDIANSHQSDNIPIFF